MLGGGAKVSVGFLKELQSVIHCHLYDDHTHTQGRDSQLWAGRLCSHRQNFTVARLGVMVGKNSISVQLSYKWIFCKTPTQEILFPIEVYIYTVSRLDSTHRHLVSISGHLALSGNYKAASIS